MKKLLFAFVLWPSLCLAQNPTCPKRPVGDSTNACASTSFVQGAVGPITGPLGGDLLGSLPNPTLNLGLSHTWTAAQTFKLNGTPILLDNTATSQQALIQLNSNGVTKWQLGKQTDDSFFISDLVASATKFQIFSNGATAITGTTSSDALDITENLNGAAKYGLSIAQTVTGSMGGAFNHNLINITSDNSQCGGGFCNGFTSQYAFGGSAMTGGRQAIQAAVQLTSPSSASNTNRNYVVGTFIATASSGDNGTNTGAGALGGMFGMNPVAQLQAGVTNWANLSGGEVDIGMDSTASTKYMLGWSVVSGYNGGSNGTGIAANFGAAFNASGISAGTLDAAYIISDINSAFPVKSAGTLIRAYIQGSTPSVTNGIDFSSVTFTGLALKTPSFSVDGSGNTSLAHLGQSGGAVIASSCGTSPGVAGSDTAGRLFTGTGATACTLTFAHAYNSVPACVVQRESSAINLIYTVSTTAISLSSVSAASGYDWVCIAANS